MRSVITTGGIPTFVSAAEHTLLERFESADIFKSELTEHEQELARRMTSRGILRRCKNDRGIYYTRNQNSSN